jgi:hypothetical protein
MECPRFQVWRTHRDTVFFAAMVCEVGCQEWEGAGYTSTKKAFDFKNYLWERYHPVKAEVEEIQQELF